MIARPELEAKGVGVCVLGKFRAAFTPALLACTKRWLARTHRCFDLRHDASFGTSASQAGSHP